MTFNAKRRSVKCDIDRKQSFERDFKRLPSEVKKEVEKSLNVISKDPYGIGQRLKGKLRGLWKYRIKDWRIIYYPRPCHVEVVLIKPRKGMSRFYK
ncbi:hypothetical protein B6U74_06140 [Candidatus Bathyarchaeota archaeon ex4484_205]|nr:MAG: hypothetical protein B6U74_06140 [Candidatus Bathyarchaeota archaeon ex4484_205]